MSKIHKIKLTGNMVYSFIGEEEIVWIPIRNLQLVANQFTTCKEEIGGAMVKRKLSEMVITTLRPLSDAQILKLRTILNAYNKKLGVKRMKIFRVYSQPSWLFIRHSLRWSRNTVAHSILTTKIRKEIFKLLGASPTEDNYHEKEGGKVLRIVEKYGLSIFGTIQHTDYDSGFVDIQYAIEEQRSYLASIRPHYRNFDSHKNYLDAILNWENIKKKSNLFNFGFLYKPQNEIHAYSKLAEIYNTTKK